LFARVIPNAARDAFSDPRPQEAVYNPNDPREARTCILDSEFWLLNSCSPEFWLLNSDL